MSPDFDVTLRAAQAGEEWALGALYASLQPRMLRYLAYQEPVAAEDLASETWIKAARGLTSFSGEEPAFRAWLFTIARHSLIDWRRGQSRRLEHSIDPALLVDARSDADTEQLALEALGTEAVIRLLSGLPQDQADVVLLRVVGGLDATRTGQVLGKRPGTIRVLQHRALQRLASVLARPAHVDGGRGQ